MPNREIDAIQFEVDHRCRCAQAQRNPGVCLQEVGHARGEPLGSEARRHRQPHAATATLTNAMARMNKLCQGGLNLREVGATILCGRYLPYLAHEQGNAEPFLKLLNLLPYRTGRHVQFPGCKSKTAVPHGSFEGRQGFQRRSRSHSSVFLFHSRH
ncbi:hypothetical protein BVI1335_1520031 [Burkholderia vietnamiensis]|nr:hypothetical protein BVI1335_1520031 [Burkholderia vietnamiensis]